MSAWDLNSVPDTCSLGAVSWIPAPWGSLGTKCCCCPPFSLLSPHIYLPVCQSSEALVSHFQMSYFVHLGYFTLFCIFKIFAFPLPLFLVLKALSVQHLFNFAFQPRQLTFAFLLCQIVRAPKALHSFFIFRKKHPSLLHIIE